MRAPASPPRRPPRAPWRPLLLTLAAAVAAGAGRAGGAQEPAPADTGTRATLSPTAAGATAGATAGARGDVADTLATTTLTVENRNHLDVVVWLERQGNRTRLGSVGSGSRARFVVPRAPLRFRDEFRFVAEAVGRRDATTGARALRAVSQGTVIGPGQRLVWTLESGLERSFLSVEP